VTEEGVIRKKYEQWLAEKSVGSSMEQDRLRAMITTRDAAERRRKNYMRLAGDEDDIAQAEEYRTLAKEYAASVRDLTGQIEHLQGVLSQQQQQQQQLDSLVAAAERKSANLANANFHDKRQLLYYFQVKVILHKVTDKPSYHVEWQLDSQHARCFGDETQAGSDDFADTAWLNTPYDSGLAFVREPDHLRAAHAATAAYLVQGEQREPGQFTPESSRRARGVEVWAALRSLGRSGIEELVERCCRLAVRFAEGLRAAGYEILKEVELNQVLARFGDDAATRRVIAAVQAEGTLWAGPTVWEGRAAMRISVSSWATTAEDVERCVAAIVGVAREVA
jgi:hypothetical protein